jgi:carboxyl-terminal processing protease
VAKASEKDKEGEGKPATPHPAAKAPTAPPAGAKPGDESSAKGTPGEPAGEASLEEDVQLQKAVELLKTWKIFKDLKPL